MSTFTGGPVDSIDPKLTFIQDRNRKRLVISPLLENEKKKVTMINKTRTKLKMIASEMKL